MTRARTHTATPDEAVFADPTRRTYRAQERTVLAWWRTALGILAAAVATGSILPKLAQLPKGRLVGRDLWESWGS